MPLEIVGRFLPSIARCPARLARKARFLCTGCAHAALIGAFHKHRPGLLEAYPKDRAKASGPWPSIRSWTNAAICAAALEAIDAEPLLRYRATGGCVGEEAALEYQTWESQLDLPDPEAWIYKATAARTGGSPLALGIPPRCDQVMAVLGALVDRVKNYDTGTNGKPRAAAELLHPKVDPARELLAKVKYAVGCTSGFGDFTYRKPNRRQPSGGALLPAHVKPIPRVTGRKKGTGTFCRNGPSGASHKTCLSPFSAWA